MSHRSHPLATVETAVPGRCRVADLPGDARGWKAGSWMRRTVNAAAPGAEQAPPHRESLGH